ncbi:hypothetical protein LOZ12_003945 [Ophidiomyces ophidiicola]|uniref:Uncharacterized protein n=1 Tax=Ophidiomyces ophidiicola TaxID=1387563 RepID=A0ACB8V1Q6_9EURO|nr:uncharacterized protein LOZ57_004321 [Ophidiomyces ophidiicola]KAI1945290.1 hypothetical protein LOZ57_004321 [Ophidiomyces ophidiicola]KAI1953489.1 hypothetical protein LOZ62_001046 [Ophidiomyces ophidiicola]KAI1971921.1 hypothetical protein LOZ56_002768 [Ophidiomyces ophidiicola]KAI2009721.1 hypothetical protein LOZ50_001455 [Ophidiomyces ophidiicola]KAI2027404.1 hypothetical protein LOZ48_004784 [Ophidiomyces ophidiicola]
MPTLEDLSSASTMKKFPHVLDDPITLPRSLDPFTITTSTGFMPLVLPPVTLPEVFAPLTSILDRTPVEKEDGTPGLLATFELGPVVEKELPDLTDEIDKLLTADGKPDLFTITAVFRDYSFLASSYLLEPCWEQWKTNPDSGYGLGRDRLPHSVAGPMYRCAELLDIPPFLSYAAAYSLFNYKLADPSKGHEYSNLRLVRAFERGLNPNSSEAGFILTHIHMVKETHALISGVVRILNTLDTVKDRKEINDAYRQILTAMDKIEECMEDMWKNSKPQEYLCFRVFIFGITSQSMFPNGVVYEGIHDNKPLYFRGESGANDSIVSSPIEIRFAITLTIAQIPLLDHLLEIPMPDTPLTKILHEFRAYRPLPHREFLAHVRVRSAEIGVQKYSVQDPETVFLYLKALDHVRSFRWRHWLFAREYIIKRTPHPTATGGSPIVTWLPNQLAAVMDLMISTYDEYVTPVIKNGTAANGGAPSESKTGATAEGLELGSSQHYRKQVEEMMETVRDQRVKLAKEVERWCAERGVPTQPK